MLDIPMSAHPIPRPRGGFAAQLRRALGWPARVLEARQIRAQLAELSEREWQDIAAGRDERFDPTDITLYDSPAERIARTRAIRAWYGHDAKAA